MNRVKKRNSKRSQQSQKRVGHVTLAVARDRTSWTKEKCVRGWRKIKKNDNEEAVLMEWISTDFCLVCKRFSNVVSASYDLWIDCSHWLTLCLSKQSTRSDSGLKKETTARNKSSIILYKTISQIFYYDISYYVSPPVVYFCCVLLFKYFRQPVHRCSTLKMVQLQKSQICFIYSIQWLRYIPIFIM